MHSFAYMLHTYIHTYIHAIEHVSTVLSAEYCQRLPLLVGVMKKQPIEESCEMRCSLIGLRVRTVDAVVHEIL
jgi:hypothetical protein